MMRSWRTRLATPPMATESCSFWVVVHRMQPAGGVAVGSLPHSHSELLCVHLSQRVANSRAQSGPMGVKHALQMCPAAYLSRALC